ncbi:MAG: UDP-N-acetylmuramoyl-L-alanyl-D-glutamate--2,6-diaminopimelate ligase [Pyrinomonadaceae bacterium]
MVTLGKLLAGVEVMRADGPGVEVEDLAYFVGDVKPGSVYVACDLPGLPGYAALDEAVGLGATVVIVDKEVGLPDPPRCRTVVVRDSRKAYSTMCANFFGNAHRRLSIYAVTGTTGKTSTCYLLESIFKSAGLKTGQIGTVARRLGDREVASSCTTPEPYELHRLLREMCGAGVTHVVLEVSSIGIAEERIWGLEFDGMVFTNLGHEHLTYHGGIENYREAKGRLFTEYASAGGRRPVCAINVDDPFGEYLASVAGGEVITYGVKGEVSGDALVLDGEGIRGEVCGVPVSSTLIGPHNAYNILGSVALARKAGLPPEAISEGISRLGSIPGRLEPVGPEGGVKVFVDYAHTPESVWVVLSTLRQIFAGSRLVAVLGCGGSSDAQKRPVMARLAVENSDACVFTTDNPRREDPLEIIGDMLKEIDPEQLLERGRLEIVLDRREAIRRSVEMAGDAGVLVILGKGHERVQLIRDKAIPFDDREVAVEALERRAAALVPHLPGRAARASHEPYGEK